MTLASGCLNALVYGVLLGIPAAVAAAADDDDREAAKQPPPEMEFLEYLGMWETSDEEWLLLEDDTVADNEKRSDPVPVGEESTETEDES